MESHAEANGPGELHAFPNQCYPVAKTERQNLITIRKFEKAIVDRLNLTAPTLDKRDRALKNAGLILNDPNRKGAIPVTPSDAAYVILVAVSNARLDDVVEAVKEIGGLASPRELDLLPGFETLHSALTTIIAQKPNIVVKHIRIRPNILEVDVELVIYDKATNVIQPYEIEYRPVAPQADITVERQSHIQQEFIVRDLFFDIVARLLDDDTYADFKGDEASMKKLVDASFVDERKKLMADWGEA